MRTRDRGQRSHTDTVGHSGFKMQHELTACLKWIKSTWSYLSCQVPPPPLSPPPPPAASPVRSSHSSVITELLFRLPA